ncbi:MAG: hypothetical protein AUJ18_03440 [Candidatus Hydrogenedentes bacterium CG1_02_42_14]|nr:MAG: hypothetical protein AUJ18_03440 [Candidatus Hydrogenedentes bacterium CG1_02_42_14]
MKNIENSKLSLAYSTPRLNYDRIVAPIASELALLDTRIQDLIERFVDPFVAFRRTASLLKSRHSFSFPAVNPFGYGVS